MTEKSPQIHIEVLPAATPSINALGKLDQGAGYVSGGNAGLLRSIAEIDANELTSGVENICGALAQAMSKAAPKSWSIEFGLGFTANGGIPILLSGQANVALKITLNWNKS